MSDLNALSIELDACADDLLDESGDAPSFYQVATALHDLAARLRGSLRHVPEGYVLLPRKLTAENGAKGLLSGEFHETTRHTCASCDGDGYIDDVQCEECEGECSVEVKVPVSWDTIKQIHRTVVDNLAVEANPAPPTSGFHDCTVRANEDICVRITSEPPTSLNDAIGYIAPGTLEKLRTLSEAGELTTIITKAKRGRIAIYTAPYFANTGDTEAQFIADGEHLNCPACGGSGHVDDMKATPAQAGAELPEFFGPDEAGCYYVKTNRGWFYARPQEMLTPEQFTELARRGGSDG